MSRIGKKPVIIPEKVEVTINDGLVKVKGPKGELKQIGHPLVTATIEDGQVLVTVKDSEDKRQRALWGLYQRLISNMVIGVTEGYEKRLEMVGIGYKGQAQGNKLILNVAFSHPVEFILPEGVSGVFEKNTIILNSIDKQLLGETAARIRRIRKPEPYKGKGIRYVGEVVRRKAGKKVGAK